MAQYCGALFIVCCAYTSSIFLPRSRKSGAFLDVYSLVLPTGPGTGIRMAMMSSSWRTLDRVGGSWLNLAQSL